MASIQIKSEQPSLGWALAKNPNSGLVAKQLRSGILFGWYSNEQTYNMLFKENNEGVSSFTKEYNYTDTSQYASSYPCFYGLSLFFSHLLSADESKAKVPLIVCNQELVVSSLDIRYENQLQFFAKHLDLDIEMEQVGYSLFQVKVKAQEKLNLFLMKTFLLFYMHQMAYGENGVVFDREMSIKVAKMLSGVKAKYFIRYFFAKYVSRSPEQLNILKPYLEENHPYDSIELQYGDTQKQREVCLFSKLPTDKPLLDFGCGEGNYTLPLSKVMPKIVAVDLQEDLLDHIKHKAKLKSIENIELGTEFKPEQMDGEFNLLMTEVVEHMPLDVAEELVEKLLSYSVNCAYITTPDKDFNQFYLLNKQFRHDDHDWEMSKAEFIAWMDGIVNRLKQKNIHYQMEWFGIGDAVNGIHTSQGVALSRKSD